MTLTAFFSVGVVKYRDYIIVSTGGNQYELLQESDEVG